MKKIEKEIRIKTYKNVQGYFIELKDIESECVIGVQQFVLFHKNSLLEAIEFIKHYFLK